MTKKNGKIKHRGKQRQKISRRTILIIAASSMACMLIGLTIFFNMSRVNKTMAAENIILVTDSDPVVEKTLDAPVIRPITETGPDVIMVRAVKADRHAAQDQHH